MERDPSKRLGATHTSDVKAHSFFASVDFQALLNREVPVPFSCPKEHRHPSEVSKKLENPFNNESKRTGNLSKDRGQGMSGRRGADVPCKDFKNSADSGDMEGWSFVGAKDPDVL